MKKIYLTLTLCAFALFSYGQNYYLVSATNAGVNPGGLNDDPEQPEAYLNGNGFNYNSVLSSTASDAYSAAQTIPFSFTFNGNNYTSYKASASGVLTFTTSAVTPPGTTPSALPASGIPNNSICAWGMDLSGANDAIVSKTFGTAPNRQHWVIWASASASGLGTGSQWAYWGIVLEESTNAVYVVDMRTYSQAGGNVALSVGLQFSSSSALQVAASPNVTSTTTATGGGQSDALDNSFYAFFPGTQPQYDLVLVDVNFPEITGTSNTNDLEGLVWNKGSQAITSFDYSFDDGAGNTGTTTFGGNLSSGGFTSLAMSPGWQAPNPGSYTLKTTVSNLNGNTDANPADNEKTQTVQAADDVPRRFLAEEFSSSTCPPCKTWNDNVYNAALANYNTTGNPIVVKYQVPIPVAGDPSHNPDSEARRAHYNISAAPTMLANGAPVDYSSIQTWADAQAAYQQAETDGGNAPAFVSVSGNATYDATIGGGQADVTVNADVTSGLDLSQGNYALQIAVLQVNYDYNQASNGDFKYKHVMRKLLPTPSGTALTTAVGATTNVSESYRFDIGGVQGGATNGNFNLWNNNVEVVLIVEDRNNKEIMNANMAGLNYVGVDEENLVKASVYPNPADDQLTIDMAEEQDLQVEIVDLSGKVLLTQDYGNTSFEQISTSALPAGMYIVKMTADGVLATQRINVVH